MLKKEQISKIAALLRLKEEELENAIMSTDEVELTLTELNVFTQDELKTRDENKTKESYKEGKNAALEMFVKEQKEKLGLEFDGKDPEKLIEAYQKKVISDAKIEPNKKVEELNTVIENLRKNISTIEEEKTNLTKTLSETKLNGTLKGFLPQNRLNVLSDDEYLTTLTREYSFVEEDGKLVVKKGSDIVRDEKTQSPLDPKAVIEGYFTNRKWVSEQDPDKKGRGDGNKKPAGSYLKLSDIAEEFEKSGKSINGSEFQSKVQEVLKANPNLDMNA